MSAPRIRVSYNAPVTLTFSFLCLAALCLGLLTNGWTTSALFSVYRSSLASPLTWFRFVGHVFGHSGFAHFLGNVLLLLVLGPNLEERFGSGNLALAILLTALISGAVQFVFFPGVSLLGASGIAFMMILLSSFGGREDGSVPLTLILVAVLYLGQEIWQAFAVVDNVSQLTHVVGGLCGTWFGFHLTKTGGKR